MKLQQVLVTLLLVVVFLVHVQSFNLPAGEYTVEVVGIERTSPDIQQSYVANLKLAKDNVIEDFHFVSEEKNGDSLYEYKSTAKLSTFVSYMFNGNKCRYASSPSISAGAIDQFLATLQPLEALDAGGNTVYDQEVHKLLQSEEYNVLHGTISVIQEEPLLLFLEKTTGALKYILGEYLFIQVNKIEQGITRDVKKIVDGLRADCISLDDELEALPNRAKLHVPPEKVPRAENALPWFYDRDEACFLPHVRDEQACGEFQASANNQKKVCVFLHGSGETESGPPTNTRKGYWGNIHEYTPQCSERWFIWANTKDNGWNDHDIQRAYCNLAAYHGKEPSGDGVIRNTIIFSHSMGNLILAGGIQNKYCSLDTETSSWYAIDSPYDGSKASTKLKKICYDYHHSESPTLFQKLFGYIAEAGGYCVPGTGKAYEAYTSVHPGYCDEEGQCIDDLEDVIVGHVKGALCGVSSIGLASKYSVMLEALSLVVDFGEGNDGMVGQSSCEKYHQDFSKKFRSSFYRSQSNHADGTCRNGDGWWSDGRKPCSWYTDKY